VDEHIHGAPKRQTTTEQYLNKDRLPRVI